MIGFATREEAELLVRKTLCSCFLAVDGTISLRREMVPDAAKTVASCLVSCGLPQTSIEVGSLERVMYAFFRPNGKKALPVSVKVSVVADRISEATWGLPLAA
jgi:hypothetical protein